MDFQSTASFTHHGNTPFVDREMVCLVFELSMYLLPWIKHKRCHADVLNQAVDNSAFLAFHPAANLHRRVGQLVSVHQRCVASHPDRHIDNVARSLRQVCPNDAHGPIV